MAFRDGGRAPLSWPHRLWFGAIFVIGICYCFAFPPFQTNDEDAHWLHLWGVAYGHLRCEEAKPYSVKDFSTIVHQKEVREDPPTFASPYQRDALKWTRADAGDPRRRHRLSLSADGLRCPGAGGAHRRFRRSR